MSLAGISTLLVVPVDILLKLVIVMDPTQILHVNFIPELQDFTFRETPTPKIVTVPKVTAIFILAKKEKWF